MKYKATLVHSNSERDREYERAMVEKRPLIVIRPHGRWKALDFDLDPTNPPKLLQLSEIGECAVWQLYFSYLRQLNLKKNLLDRLCHDSTPGPNWGYLIVKTADAPALADELIKILEKPESLEPAYLPLGS